MNGNEQLHQQLTALDKSLRAFEDPAVEEFAGLRLMHETLKERRQHIVGTITENETCTIELTLSGAAHGRTSAPATLVAYVLDAVAAAVEVAGLAHAADWTSPPAGTDLTIALSCHVKALSVDGDDVRITMTRPPGPVATQVADPDSGAPLFEHAALAAFTLLEDPGHPHVPDHLAPSLHGLGEAISGGELVLEWQVAPFVLDAAAGTLDQAAAQRLAADTTG